MATVVITAVSSQDLGDLSFANWGKSRIVRELDKMIVGLGLGAFTGSLDVQNAPAYASGTLTIAGGTGTVGGTIGGKAVTVIWATSDTATATALAAAINADTTANQFVSASAAAGVVTITAIMPGTIGNGLTLVASGPGVTASGARLAGGTGAPGNSFTC